MDMQKLLLDATGALPGSSRRSQCIKLIDIIAEHPGDKPPPSLDTTLQWFRRRTMPTDRLVQMFRAVQQTKGRELNLLDYA